MCLLSENVWRVLRQTRESGFQLSSHTSPDAHVLCVSVHKWKVFCAIHCTPRTVFCSYVNSWCVLIVSYCAIVHSPDKFANDRMQEKVCVAASVLLLLFKRKYVACFPPKSQWQWMAMMVRVGGDGMHRHADLPWRGWTCACPSLKLWAPCWKQPRPWSTASDTQSFYVQHVEQSFNASNLGIWGHPFNIYSYIYVCICIDTYIHWT